jgi:signal transduction histidine kinase
VAAPIVVEGIVWGAITVSDAHQRLPSDAEGRLAAFTELVATAIANAESRTELAVSEARAHDLAREQAALRRVATLVAKGASSDELFSAVANVVAGIFDVPVVGIHRYEADGTVTTLGIAGETSLTVGMRLRVTDEGIAAMMLSTGGPARIDDFAGVPRDAVREDLRLPMVGVPILVEGGIWGFMVAAAKPDSLIPADTEERLARFTELVATAVANSQARERVAQLADEQAALRRVAALVAGGASSTAVFDAVAQEVAQVFQVAPSLVACYEDDGATMRVLAAHPASFAFGSRWPLDGPSVAAEVLRSGRPVRMEDWTDLPGTLAAVAREHGLTRVAGAPIIVDGRVWGLVAVAGPPDERLPENLEDRLAEFTELLGTAMANAESRAELDASRARIVATADATRRRIERDLHDGIQQWLVAVTLKARKAAAFGPSGSPHEEFVRIADDLETVLEELREISRGIHPAILSNAGLDDALEALARRSAIPVVLDIDFEGRYEPSVEATVYYVVAESITNAVKHANASVVAVRGAVRDGTIELEIQDDGVGGAEPSRGSGITGLKDRVDTLGGTISLSSPVGAGTTIRMRLPVSPPDEGNRLVGRSVDPGPVSSDSG